MIIDTILLPDGEWIPDPNRLSTVAEDLLLVATAALKQYNLYDGTYERVYVGHGTRRPVEQSKKRQLSVTLPRLATGRAGEENYRFPAGELQRVMYDTLTYLVEIVHPWPVRQNVEPIPVPQIEERRLALWQHTIIVRSAYKALMLGGVKAPSIAQDDMVSLGPLQPRDPSGGQASFSMTVEVQL